MNYLSTTISQLKQSSPAQTEFYQAVEEVLRTLEPVLEKKQLLCEAFNYTAIS